MKYAGTTSIKGNPTLHVYVVDQIPNSAPAALLLTQEAFEAMKGSIAPEEVDAPSEEVPENTNPVVMQKEADNKVEPAACRWAHGPGGIVIGCPRCGRKHVLPEPAFTVTAFGDVKQPFKCGACHTHRYLQLADWSPS